MALLKYILFVFLFINATSGECPAEDAEVKQTPSMPANRLAIEIQDIIEEYQESDLDCEVLSIQTLPDGDQFFAILFVCCNFDKFTTTEEEEQEHWTTE